MALQVEKDLQIVLNGNRYNIREHLVAQYVSKLPGKVNVGEDSYSTQNYLSNLIVNDQRGGLGVEEMDESIHADRYWWGNCITDWKGHIYPPRLAVSQTLTVYTTFTLLNGDMELAANWAGGRRSSLQKHAGTYSWEVNGDDVEATQDLAVWDNAFRGTKVTVTMWLYNTNARFEIKDGTATTSSAAQTSGAAWQQLSATHTFDAAATKFQIRLINDSGGGAGNDMYFDDVTFYAATAIATSNVYMENFNGELYVAHGNVLYKLASGRASLTYLYTFPAAITALRASLNSRLYIYLGDSDNYWSMNTSEAFTETNVSDANLAVQWDSKLIKLSSTGAGDYSTDPESATPTWNTTGDITDIGEDVETLFIGKDATGNDVVYAASHSWLMVLDFGNTKWLNTALKLPDHPKGGLGATYWHGAHYIPYGLGVKKYVSGSTATISEAGLIKDDGLPVEYNGEIVKLLGESASDDMFALVDASLTSGNSKSGLYAYNDRGWKCWWVDTANNGVMHDCIVSSAESGYAVYWDCGGKLYYIDIHRGISNPEQLVGVQTYLDGGVHVTAWFDAGTAAFKKLAQKLTSWAKGITTTETVVIKYRTDKSNTTVEGGWTLLETLNSAEEDGVNEELFASGAGLVFQSYQLRFEFARGSTNTDKADLQAIVLAYEKLTGGDGNWIWTLPIILDDDYNTTPAEKEVNLKIALELESLPAFLYRKDDAAETKYVRLHLISAWTQTGLEFQGEYFIQAIEV